jgi:glycosyltransferase involved in cell wall biosynthesis
MFLGLPQKVAYVAPWFASFEERFAKLSSGPIKVAYFYESQDSSTFRYRVYNMVETLNSAPDEFSAAFFTLDDLTAMNRVISAADILVLCRVRYTDIINNMILQARAKGCKVFYDIDDLIFDTEYAHLVINTLGEELSDKMWNRFFAYMSRLGTVMKLCDGVIVTNRQLAVCANEYSGLNTHVAPNFLNDAQLNLSRQLYMIKKEDNFKRDETIHVGYFSGSPTHNRDFSIVLPALVHLLQHNKRVKLRLGGYLEAPELEQFSDRIEKFPMQDFMNLQLLQAKTEVNLVPLQSNLFTDCKSDLKYFEAAIVGTITVASPAFAYKESIKDGTNGFLASDQDWENQIDAAIYKVDESSCRSDLSSRDDSSTSNSGYATMAECAYADSENRYSSSAQLPILRSIFQRSF